MDIACRRILPYRMRADLKEGVVRYVLIVGLVLVVIAFVIAYVFA
jgi:hypothetical protein